MSTLPAPEPETSTAANGHKKKKFFTKPKPKIDKRTLPQPKSKSTTSTTLTNDPLWQEAFVIEGENGLTSEKAAQEFSADAAGYSTLVEEEYKAISDCDKHYAKSVPASAHAYYHTIVLWYKYALMAQKHGTAEQDQERLIHFVDGYEAVVAAGAGTYLAGVGDYEDATGVKHVFAAEQPNNNGHFGAIGPQTHSRYERLPSPSVALQRVLEDMAAGDRDYDDHNIWMVQGLAPPAVNLANVNQGDAGRAERRAARAAQEEGGEQADPEGGLDDEDLEDEAPAQRNLPTVNLLGWRPSLTLIKNQQAELRTVFDDERDVHQVHRTIPRYALVRELFEFVYRKLRECKRYKVTPIPKSTTGSMAQQATWVPEYNGNSRLKAFISGEGKVKSRTTLPVRISVAAKIMCYRSIRRNYNDDQDIERRPWACYHYNGYERVPDPWSGNRNAAVHRGTDGLVAYAPFASTTSSRHDAIVEFLNKFKAP